MTMETVKSILEILYLASGPIIAIVASIALFQIKIAKDTLNEYKKTMIIGAKRDSLKETSEQVKNYLNNIVPLINELNEAINKEKLLVFKQDNITVINGKLNCDYEISSNDWDKIIKIISEISPVLNAIESFSLYFTSMVADENKAYISIGNTYCGTISNLYPLIILYNKDSKNYNATIELFTLWVIRKEQNKINKEQEELNEKTNIGKQKKDLLEKIIKQKELSAIGTT